MPTCADFLNTVPQDHESFTFKKFSSKLTSTTFEVYNGIYTTQEMRTIDPLCYIKYNKLKKQVTVFNENWNIIAFCYKTGKLFVITKCLLPLAVFQLATRKSIGQTILICNGHTRLDPIEYFHLIANSPESIDENIQCIHVPFVVNKNTQPFIKSSKWFQKQHLELRTHCNNPLTPLIQLCVCLVQHFN